MRRLQTAAKVHRHAKVQADGLGMTNVQKAIWFWWKSCDDSPAIAILTNILRNNRPDKVKIRSSCVIVS